MTTTLDEIRTQLEEIIDILDGKITNLVIAANQIETHEGLSDIDGRLGVVQAGEFRTGNGKLPGDGFTGGRFGFPGFIYGTSTYFLAGVDNDVLQVGLSLTDGKIYFGAGTGVLDSTGIKIIATGVLVASNGYKFVDADGTTILGGVYTIVRHDAFDDAFVELRAQTQDSSIQVVTASVDAVAPATAVSRLTVDSGGFAGAASMLILTQTASGGLLVAQDTASTFNSTFIDADFIVNGDTVQVLKVDAGFDRMEIGVDHFFATRSSTNPNTYINEANQDMDTFIRSVNFDDMFVVDAGLDKVLIKGAALREPLSAARTYYVRTDGSDSHTGLVDTAGGAFLTVQKAIDVASGLDNNGYDVTIQIRDGTYAAGNFLRSSTGSGYIIIQGNSGTPANVSITGTVTSATSQVASFVATALSTKYKIKDLKIANSAYAIFCESGSYVEISNLDFGACTFGHMFTRDGGKIMITGGYTISGNTAIHWQSNFGGVIRTTTAVTITLTGTPAWSGAGLSITAGMVALASITFSGSATGTRYVVSGNGVEFGAAGVTTYFPGNAAGSTATGGQYL
jgi:hypothetical protein